MSVTQVQRDRAARGGRLAAKAGKSPAHCPYDANGSPDQRVLAVVFVRAFSAAGGKLDGLHYDGDGGPVTRRGSSPTKGGGRHRAADPYGHLGYGR